jgi:hypothetical protein
MWTLKYLIGLRNQASRLRAGPGIRDEESGIRFMARVIALVVLAAVAVSAQTGTAAKFDVVSIKRNLSGSLGSYEASSLVGIQPPTPLPLRSFSSLTAFNVFKSPALRTGCSPNGTTLMRSPKAASETSSI